jgi:hypothetical protein
MPQQRSFVESLEPQQRANYHKATRKQPENNQKPTSSSWPNIIPPHIPQHMPEHIPQHMPQQRAFVRAQQPQQTPSNHKTTGKQTKSNPKATGSCSNIAQNVPRRIPPHIPQHIPQQRAFARAQEPQQIPDNQKATRKQPARNQKADVASLSATDPGAVDAVNGPTDNARRSGGINLDLI